VAFRRKPPPKLPSRSNPYGTLADRAAAGQLKLLMEPDLDIGKVAEALGVLKEDVVEAADRVLFDVAQEARDYVRKTLFKQGFKMKRLSKRWKRWKERHELDTRILVASRKYAESINVEKAADAPGEFGYVVRPSTTKLHPGYPGKRSKDPKTMAYIGAVHEFGATWKDPRSGKRIRIPARPHWGPTREHFEEQLDVISDRIMQQALLNFDARMRDAKREAENVKKRQKAK
jgi:hypothetical protein